MLDDEAMPAAFRSADRASLDGQRSAVAQIRWSLRLGVLAAAAGIVTWRVGDGDLDVMAALAGVAFLGALFLTLRLGAEGFEARWYRGRAIAESVKTLAWRYSVGGDPFGLHSAIEVDGHFVERVNEVIERGGPIQLEPMAGDQITVAMRELRARPLPERREAYILGRVNDQEAWYTGKAKANNRSASRWSVVAAVANLVGFGGAALRFVGWVEIDLLGVAAAAAGAATAWSQLRQHRILGTSYALAAQELSLVREKLRGIGDEDAWALAVSDAEDAISREHTMWLARHGHSAV